MLLLLIGGVRARTIGLGGLLLCHWLELLPAISESLPAASTMRARALVITPDQPARGPYPGSPSHAATANEREAKRAVGRRAGWPLRTLTVPGGSAGGGSA